MSYGSRKAIAGNMKAAEFARQGCEEAIRRYEHCYTVEDVRAVLAWAKERGGWFHRTGDDDRRMRAAFEKAKKRAEMRAFAPFCYRRGHEDVRMVYADGTEHYHDLRHPHWRCEMWIGYGVCGATRPLEVVKEQPTTNA